MLTGEPPPKPNGKARAEPKKIVAERFDYPDADGKLLLQVERVEFLKADGTFVITKDSKSKKTFRQRQPDPERPGEWIWNVGGIAPIPYRLPELIEAVGNKQTILIVEGEAKVNLLRSWNVPATCCLWARGSGGQSTPHSCKMPTLCCFLIIWFRLEAHKRCWRVPCGHCSSHSRPDLAGPAAEGRHHRLGDGWGHSRGAGSVDRGSDGLAADDPQPTRRRPKRKLVRTR